MQSFADRRREYLAPKEAAAIIGVTVSTLCIWRKQKRGPNWRRTETSRIYYPRSELEEWFNKYFG